MSLHAWMHVVAPIDTCALPKKTQFCDEKGYNIVLICTIQVINSPKGCTIDSENEIFYHNDITNNVLSKLTAAGSKLTKDGSTTNVEENIHQC